MNVRKWSATLTVAAAVLGSTLWSARQLDAGARAARMSAAGEVMAEQALHTADIAFYEARAAADPQSAMDRTSLGTLYLQRARESNDHGDYLRAEQAARASLSLRVARNGAAYAVLASALLAQHRFVEARDAARQLVAAEPTVDAYRGLLGEACLEAGDYVGAHAAFTSITAAGRASLAVTPRLARWAEIRGDTATARRLIRAAVNTAARKQAMPREQAAWFFLRAGDLELRQGRVQRAERTLRDGLAQSPLDHRLLSALARVYAARHQWREAIAHGDSAIAIVLDPATLGVVSDAHRALGDTAKAAEYVATMEVAVGQQPGAYHRAWSLFLLDHGRRIPEVLRAAQAEIVERPDIYGYDLLAWSLYRSGRIPEARESMGRALAQGTQDAMLLYHAGMIEQAARRPAAARAYLQRALAISRYFDHTAPDIARATLESLPPPVPRAVAATIAR